MHACARMQMSVLMKAPKTFFSTMAAAQLGSICDGIRATYDDQTIAVMKGCSEDMKGTIEAILNACKALDATPATTAEPQGSTAKRTHKLPALVPAPVHTSSHTNATGPIHAACHAYTHAKTRSHNPTAMLSVHLVNLVLTNLKASQTPNCARRLH